MKGELVKIRDSEAIDCFDYRVYVFIELQSHKRDFIDGVNLVNL